jgi:hypothetical protein
MGDRGIAALYSGGSSMEMPMMPRPRVAGSNFSRWARNWSRNRTKSRLAMLDYWPCGSLHRDPQSVLAVLGKALVEMLGGRS